VTRGPTNPAEAQAPTPPDPDPPGGNGPGGLRLPGVACPPAASQAHRQAAPLYVAKPEGHARDTSRHPRAHPPTVLGGGAGSGHQSAQLRDHGLAERLPAGESSRDATTVGSRRMAPRAPVGASQAGEARTLEDVRVRGLVAGQWLGAFLSARTRRDMPSQATSRRRSESRLRATLMSGSRWQGVEPRPVVPGATP